MSSSSWYSRPVFVYGTLKHGQPNHGLLETAINSSQAEFLGQATTVDCWPLIIYSSFNIPFLLDCKGTGKASLLLVFGILNTIYTIQTALVLWLIRVLFCSVVCVFDQNLLMVVNISRFWSKTHATEQNSTHIPCIVSPSKLLLSCIRISTVDARRTSVTLSCLLRPTRMYARTQFGRRAFSVAGPDIWNSLPATIRTIDSHPVFRRALKTHLFRSAFDH